MKQRFIIIISVIVSLLFIMMAFSGNIDKNSNIINNDVSNNDYVKIGNITFMNNFNISNNGISFNNINKTNINNINNYDNIYLNNKNNNKTIFNAYKGNIIHKNNINYTLLYFKNIDVKNAITFTEKFNNYKVEIANVIYNNSNNDNISYIYANIVPINSSKILLGNEFTLDYKSTYNNEIKNLINTIELISLNYMNSNNNTLYKFGMEYSYIALAMNNMLKLTNNNIKNMEINKTIGIAIDWSTLCDFLVASLFMAVLAVILFPPAAGLVWYELLAYVGLTVGGFSIDLIGTLCTCYN